MPECHAGGLVVCVCESVYSVCVCVCVSVTNNCFLPLQVMLVQDLSIMCRISPSLPHSDLSLTRFKRNSTSICFPALLFNLMFPKSQQQPIAFCSLYGKCEGLGIAPGSFVFCLWTKFSLILEFTSFLILGRQFQGPAGIKKDNFVENRG